MTAVTRPISWILRVEGLIFFILALGVYSKAEFSWVAFAALFLVPDISLAGYLISNKFGAIAYNLAHSYIGAVSCLALGYLLTVDLAILIGLIWVAHIGFDRALGYGLKSSQGFGFTHLGVIGKAKSN